MKNEIQNIDQLLVSYKPPIFWKEKAVIKDQIKYWKEDTIKDLIYKINNIELMVKKNTNISLNLVLDFLIEQSSSINN